MLWLKVDMMRVPSGMKRFEWKNLCSATPGYYFTAKEVLEMVVSKYKWEQGIYRILPAGRKPKGAK